MAEKGRIPPQNLEAEQSILGCILLSREAMFTASEVLRAEDFYYPAHQEIFSAMVILQDSGKPIDLVTLVDILSSRGSLEGIGGIPYLTELTNFVPSAANIQTYVDIGREKSVLRQLIKSADDINAQCYEGQKEAADILAYAERCIFDIAMSRTKQSLEHVAPIALRSYTAIEHAFQHQNRITGLATGFTDLDYRTTGFHGGELILIASRPAGGKSSLGMNIAEHVSIRESKPVAVFSLEMSKEQLVQRTICSQSGVDSQKARAGELSMDDWQKITQAMGGISAAPLYIDDTAGISVNEIRTKCRRLKIEKGLSLVVIDYLQLMEGSHGSKGSENRQQEISQISRSLKILSKELNVPVIALAQLSRAPETRQDHRPLLSDLRESGAIEQDADVVMFIYREGYYNKDCANPNEVELIVAKQRNGPTGTVLLQWVPHLTKFMSATPR